MPPAFAGNLLELVPGRLRRRIESSGASTRHGAEGEEVRLDQIEVDTATTAHLLGISGDSARARARRGEMGARERAGRYYFPLGRLEFTVREAATLLGTTPETVRGRADRGELSHRRDQHGRRHLRFLDVLAAAGETDSPADLARPDSQR